MSTPYWGNLPGPKLSGNAKARRASDDYSSGAARRASLDEPAGQPPTKANRVSIQTAHTTATDSTLSPYASPTASSFAGQGLAPRPPTLPYGQAQYPPEVAEKRRRRASRNREEDYEYSTAAAPPAAPDVPKAPPSSFRHPFGNGGLPYTFSKAGGPPQDYPISPPAIMDPEDYYKSPTPDKQANLPVLDRAQNTLDRNSSSRRHAAPPRAAQANGQQVSLPAGGDQALHHRRASLGTQSDRRNITKEEKRARVEAAEQRARDRATREPDRGTSQPQVRFKERRPSIDQDTRRPQVLPDPIQAQPAIAANRGPLSQNPPEEGKRYSSSAGRSPKGPNPESRIPVPSGAHGSALPQRNLSFRERAARNDIKLPDASGDASPTSPTATTPTGGTSLTRSGSNKLKKDPPGDPWFNRRAEAEKKYPVVQPRHGLVEDARNAPVDPTVPRSARQVQPVPAPPLPREARIPSGARGPVEQGSPIHVADTKFVKTPSQRGAPPPGQVPPRSFSLPTEPTRGSSSRAPAAAVAGAAVAAGTAAAVHGRRQRRADSDDDHSSDSEDHHFSDYVYHGREKYTPGQGMYNPPRYLDEWKKGTIGTLSGSLLDLDQEAQAAAAAGNDQAWWETPPSKRRGSMSSRPRKAEAFDGEYDETQAPTRFKPALYLKCGPLLRYCGIRHERVPTRSARNGAVAEREIWRGTVMIVTQDKDSSYDIAPTLRLFVQPIELLPPPPTEIQDGQGLPPEYVDPISGHPKLGRKGETLYVRPVEHLEEMKDLSRDETDDGLFEKSRSPPDVPPPDGSSEVPGSFAYRRKRTPIDGEKVGKYKDVRGYRLHTERGYTFWRFSIEVELREKQQRIAYRINRGPATGFWVPAKGQTMNIMFHSCNGFSLSVNPDELSGPDPLWRDVLNNHQTQPFHVMIGGGDQLYCDAVMRQTKLFQEWLMIKNPLHKHNAPFTAAMQDELENFYLERYCMWFSQGLFGLANSQIPMVNMYDDHDIIDGFGSYPHHFMHSPVFRGLGNVAFKYYMLFQHQSVIDETEESEPSWTLGIQPGPYIHELSRSVFLSLGSRVALLAVDCRTERTRDEVIRDETWKRIMDRAYAEIVKGKTEHLLVLLGVPIAYPRLVWLENILTSRLMDPIKALSKTGIFGNVLNKFDGGVEVLDDLDDHWTAKNHKHERSIVLEDLQDLAADKSVRITILSGDVHLAAVGQFFSNPKLGLAKHKDFRYMPNVISSAIVNTPPSDLLADVLNKRNKVHHFDKDTDEDMMPIFGHGVEGKPRNNKRLLPHRNWCSIREYVPGNTPPSSPQLSAYDNSPVTTPGGAGKVMRRLSKRNRGPAYRPDVIDSRPPVSGGGGGGGLFRSFSRGRSSSESGRPGMLTRTLSLTRGDFSLFRRNSRNNSHPDDGGINGTWGDSDEDDRMTPAYPPPRRPQGVDLRGGSGGFNDEYSDGDDSYFTTRAPRNTSVNKAARILGTDPTRPATSGGPAPESAESFQPRPFHRTPTGLSTKQKKRAEEYEVNIEGGLDICLNVEVSAKDPTGITVPYRLLVPKLWYEYTNEEPEMQEKKESGIRRLLSLNRNKPAPVRGNEVEG